MKPKLVGTRRDGRFRKSAQSRPDNPEPFSDQLPTGFRSHVSTFSIASGLLDEVAFVEIRGSVIRPMLIIQPSVHFPGGDCLVIVLKDSTGPATSTIEGDRLWSYQELT